MLNKFCCGSLTTGGLIVGCLGIVFSSIFIIFDATALANVDEVANVIESYIHGKVNRLDLEYALKCYLVGSVLSVVISSLLVMGIKKKRPGLMMPWMVITGLGMVLNICYVLSVFLNVILDGGRSLPNLIFAALYLSLNLYIYYAMYSLYDQICRGNANPCIDAGDRVGPEAAAGLYPV